ncbi:MAG: hypothetical protein QM669_12585 [Siphonobacter sp.]
MKTIFAFISTLISCYSAFSQDIQGLWFNEEKTSKVQIYKQSDRYFEKISWIKMAFF